MAVCETKKAVLMAMCVTLFVQCLGYVSVVPDSHRLSRAIGEDATFSGKMVGIFHLGTFCGSLGGWGLLLWQPAAWRKGAYLLPAGLLCQIVGDALYTWVTLTVVGIHSRPIASPGGLNLLLLIARCICGTGFGWNMHVIWVTASHLTQSADRPRQVGFLQLSIMMALGLGPMIASMAQVLDGNNHQGIERFELVAFINLMSDVMVLVFVAVQLPSFKDLLDYLQVELEEIMDDQLSHRRTVVCGCSIMAWLRATAVSGTEVGTALLLENKYHRNLGWVGVVIGVTFLGCIPLQQMYNSHKEKWEVITWIRSLTWMVVLGSTLLFDVSGNSSWINAASVSLGGVILFPSLYLSEVLSLGVQQQHLLPAGSFFDVNNTAIMSKFLTFGAGRCLGPWLARWLISNGSAGQNLYALMQFTSAVTFQFVFEVAVAPFVSPSNH